MAKKKADEIKKSLGLDKKAQNFYSGENAYVPEEQPKENKKTVIGINEAERLQKAGWRLVDCHPVSADPFGDKEYKFERIE